MNPGRNDPCHCGSGKKYKNCCLHKNQSAAGKEDKVTERTLPAENFNAEENCDEEDTLDSAETLVQVMTSLRRFVLDRKPHIKAYYKLRSLHAEIADAMVKYHQDGSFEQVIDRNYMRSQYDGVTDNHPLMLLETSYDFNTSLGTQAFYDTQIYRPAPNMNCITDVFLEKHRYRKEEKIAFLRSMLNSVRGLFEITRADANEGYVYLKEVFTGKEYTITDVALSGNDNYGNIYYYTRIIEHQGIAFSSGLNIVLRKNDPFIQKHIRYHRKHYNPDAEFIRFTQVYNHFRESKDSIKVVTNSL